MEWDGVWWICICISEGVLKGETIGATWHREVGDDVIILVEQVVDFQRAFEGMAMQGHLTGEGQVMRVPGLQVIDRDIGALIVAITGIDKAIVQGNISPIGADEQRSA